MSGAGRQVARARSISRRLLVQALYQWQMTREPWQDLHGQYAADPGFGKADAAYFQSGLEATTAGAAALDEVLAQHSSLPPERLDPVEHAVLWVGLWELMQQPAVPYRVVINEAIELAKRFGATDGHKFVNAVLDKAARQWRSAEHGAVA